MPKLTLTKAEAAAITRKRARDKAWNTAIMAAVETVKKRTKANPDPMALDTLHSVLGDLRRMIR
jgi:hypothetical protein